MKTTLILLLIAVLAAVFTNPDIKAHKDQINIEFKDNNPLAGLLGGGKVLGEIVQYEDYKILSITKVQDKPLSIGIFSKVIVLRDVKL